MSILFEETPRIRKKVKSCNNLKKLQSSFSSAKTDESPIAATDLFAAPVISKKKNANKMKGASAAESVDSVDLLQAFYNDHPIVHKYAILTPVFDTDLNSQQIVDRIVRSANSNTVIISNFSRRIVFKLEQIDNEHQQIIEDKKKIEVPPGATFLLRSLISLKFYNKLRINELKSTHTRNIQHLVQIVGRLLETAIKNPTTKEVKLNHQLLENDLNDYRGEVEMAEIHKNQKAIKQRIKKMNLSVDLSQITKICKSLFKEEEHFFVDKGRAESMFFVVMDQMTGPQREYIERCINDCTLKPNLCGKIIFGCTSNFLQIKDLSQDTLQYYFILFVRYFFSRMFICGLENQTYQMSISHFTKKVNFLLKRSPLELGFEENFLQGKYKTMALSAFPADNPYKDAISVFSSLPYNICPIDFCRTMHEGLKVVQNIASQISFEEKYRETKKVYAKSDHLLCLDDLFDITLITMLLANPIPVYQLVHTFQPFITGLQMISELEFAFTNANALMQHITELDTQKFSQAAKMRVEESMEVDPLNILGK